MAHWDCAYLILSRGIISGNVIPPNYEKWLLTSEQSHSVEMIGI